MSQVILKEMNRSFRVNTNQRYACEDCPAKCCRFPWKIPVTPEEYQHYMETPWIVAHLKANDTKLIQQNDGGHIMPFTAKSDGSRGCVFLNDENMCTIQLQEGHLFIPKTCQHYPFGFVENQSTREIIPVHSYFCQSILHNYGRPVAEIVADRYNIYSKHLPILTMPATLQVGKIAIEKEAYLRWMDYAHGLFTGDHLSAAEALMVVRRMIGQMMTNLADGSPASIDALIRETNTSIDRYKDFSKAPKGSLSARTLTAIDNLAFVVINDPSVRDQEQTGSNFRIDLSVKTYKLLMNIIFSKGEILLWNLPKPVDLTAAGNVLLYVGDPEIQVHLKRYLATFFEHPVLSIKNGLINSVFLLGTKYAASLILSKYMAFTKDHKQVMSEDLLEAIGYVDICDTSQGRLNETTLTRLKKTITDLLALRKDTFTKLMNIC